jgi:translation initiation factor IF-2
MAKVKVSDLAKRMGISDKDLIFKLQSLGVQVDDASSSIDHEIIQAILTGKKLQSRPRNVIMREELPQTEKKTVVVRPPRPIVKPPKREETAQSADAPASQAPLIIPEFIQAVEAEAAEQERAAKEPPKKAAPKPKPEAPVARPTPPPAPTHAPSHAPSHAPQAAGRTGATGPRAQAPSGPRPNYQGQPVRPMAASSPSAARPDSRVAPSSRPSGPGRPGTIAGPGRSAAGPGLRPSGSRVPMMPPPPAPGLTISSPLGRRKKVEDEEERPEKKKTTGKRGKRTSEVEVDDNLFTKGPFSATAVLAEDSAPIPAEAELTEEELERKKATRRDSRKQAAPVSAKVLEFHRPTGKVTLTEGVTVKALADKLGVKANDLMKHLLMKKGMMLSINAPLGRDLALEIVKELDVEADIVSFEEALELESIEKMSTREGSAGAVHRAPVVTVMGHVDHGKTSLLDAIRETKVAAGEAGGITQHIGAYRVEKRGRDIVFLDTPGHEAFTMMRARGAKVTDIVILVVAADDSVMPQTREAIDHARAAKVPIIVAINKIDKPNANVDKVRRDLSTIGVAVEQYGGDVVSVEVSAVKKTGIEDLLEMILLTADMLDVKASPDMPARGVILEARKDVGRGIVATVLVQDGTLRVGEPFISGSASGRVRAMTDDRGTRLKEAGPATPVSVMGFDDIPNAGDTFLVVDEGALARMMSEMRQEKQRESMVLKGSRMSLDQLFEKMQAGIVKDLNLILKADVQGSVEVLTETLRKLSNEQVKVNVLHASVGAISTNDVLLASASNAIVVGFSVRPERSASDLAEKEGVEIRLHTIIYELIDEMKLAMTGLLDPRLQETFQGRAQVRNTFKVPKAGTIAGCYVTEGTIPRSASVRLLRDNRVIYEGKIESLRHFKNDVSEVKQGFECGIALERFQDVKVGDIIEAFKVEKLAAVLQ